MTASTLAPLERLPRAADKYDAPLLMARRGVAQFHVMAKPVGPSCNLNCTYCYYLGKGEAAGGSGTGRMSDETLERFVRRYIEAVSAPEVVFSWQGGEPTLRGLDFFRNVVALQRRHARSGQRIQNDLQTNGTLLDESWCEFLKKEGFLVGLSIDGPGELHDRYRVCRNGEPTFGKVMSAVGLLHRFGVPFNTLTCVHRLNARKPLDIYRFLRDEVGAKTMQFTPVVEYRGFDRASPRTLPPSSLPLDGSPAARPGHPDSIVTDWSVDPDDWGYFLCRLFDRWASRDAGKILVNQFETLMARRLGQPPQMCVYSEHCGKALAVEHDGALYACDHFVYPDYRVGQLDAGPLLDIAFSREQVQFGYGKSDALPSYCRLCTYLSDCWGECPKNRIVRTPQGDPGLNYLCRGLKAFYVRALPEVERIVNAWQRNRGLYAKGL